MCGLGIPRHCHFLPWHHRQSQAVAAVAEAAVVPKPAPFNRAFPFSNNAEPLLIFSVPTAALSALMLFTDKSTLPSSSAHGGPPAFNSNDEDSFGLTVICNGTPKAPFEGAPFDTSSDGSEPLSLVVAALFFGSSFDNDPIIDISGGTLGNCDGFICLFCRATSLSLFFFLKCE